MNYTHSGACGRKAGVAFTIVRGFHPQQHKIESIQALINTPDFRTVYGLARLSGSNWYQLGNAHDVSGTSLAIYRGRLVAAGFFGNGPTVDPCGCCRGTGVLIDDNVMLSPRKPVRRASTSDSTDLQSLGGDR